MKFNACVVIFVMLGLVTLSGCGSRKFSKSEILEERIRRPAGTMSMPSPTVKDEAKKGADAGETSSDAGR